MTVRLTNDFVTVREASRHLATVIARAQEGHPQVITRGGRPAAVLVDPAQYEALAALLDAATLQERAEVAQVAVANGSALHLTDLASHLAAIKRRFSPDRLPEADFAQYTDLEEPLGDGTPG